MRENIILSEVSQAQKDKSHMFSPIRLFLYWAKMSSRLYNDLDQSFDVTCSGQGVTLFEKVLF
jgi:hypothetical protein